MPSRLLAGSSTSWTPSASTPILLQSVVMDGHAIVTSQSGDRSVVLQPRGSLNILKILQQQAFPTGDIGESARRIITVGSRIWNGKILMLPNMTIRAQNIIGASAGDVAVVSYRVVTRATASLVSGFYEVSGNQGDFYSVMLSRGQGIRAASTATNGVSITSAFGQLRAKFLNSSTTYGDLSSHEYEAMGHPTDNLTGANLGLSMGYNLHIPVTGRECDFVATQGTLVTVVVN